MKMSELTGWFTAVGTMLAAIVALFIAFLPSLLKRYNRPKLAIEFKNEEPFCRTASVTELKYVEQSGPIVPKEVLPPYYWVRIRVLNVGKSVAKGCEGKLVRIQDAKTKEEMKNFDPIVLPWVGATYSSIGINKNEYEYLNILATAKDDAKHLFIKSIDEKLRGINLAPERKDYIFHIVLYGADVEPLKKLFYLRNHEQYDKIKLSSFKP